MRDMQVKAVCCFVMAAILPLKKRLLELPFVFHLFAATLLFNLLRTVTKVTTNFTSDVFVLQLVAFTSSYRNGKILQQCTRLLPYA